jgi:hypothetical protein
MSDSRLDGKKYSSTPSLEFKLHSSGKLIGIEPKDFKTSLSDT